MFLKSIEIRGFKSFADKTELTFKKGITAVVGPNGSGKSNISDAVRWVLGEQSVRNLRGDKMEDVIFAGTQFRKPVGLAQVALTLDNSDCELDIDYSNVTISRRLYRSGESEYLINNTSCRLKDVQQLFMDTGIGKEGYSIIGQGKIDAILSGKTEERRKLFEEAAGIVKFKSRKEEAEKRLDITQQNLIRIEDILSTYEERLEPLMIESEKAKKFLKFFEELKSKEVSLIIDAINKVEEKIKNTQGECSRLKLEVINITEEKNQLKKDVEYWNGELEKFEIKNQEEKQLYYNNKLIYQNSISEINILKERIENLVKLIDKTSKDSDGIHEKLSDFKVNLHGLENSLSNIKNTQIEIEEKIQTEEMKIKVIQENIAVESAQAQSLKDEEQNNTSKTILLTNRLLILNNNIEVAKRRVELLKNNIENFNNSIKSNVNIKIMFQSKMEEFKEKIFHYENQLSENKREITKLQNMLNNDEITMKNYNFKINKTEANFNVLTTLEKKHEGYNKSVKNLMQHINEGKVGNIHECFVLGEVIKVEKELEVAIEIALGGSISHMITKDETVAKLLISYLKSNNLGRATFLPLNIIKGKMLTIDNETKNSPGYVGIANQLVGFDEKFSEVISFILGRTIICKDMDSALYISKRNNFRYKIVTLSGEVINLGGSLTGGSVYSKTSSIIGRKREIEELAKDLNTLKSESIIYLEKIKQSKSEILRLEKENINLKDEAHFENIEKTKMEAKINTLEDETNRLKNNIMTLDTEKLSEESKLKIDNSEVDEKNVSVCELARVKDEIQQNQSNVGLTLKDKLQEIENIKASIIDAKIKKAGIDETIRNKVSEIKRLNEEILVYNNKIIVCSKEIQEAMINKKTSADSIQNSEEKANEILTTLENMEKNFEASEIQRIKIKDKIKINVEQLENVSQILEKSEKDLYKCELILEKVGMEKDNYYQKLNEDFELTYAEALEFKYEIDDIDKLKKEILALKGNISKLGKVNVGAIEEYKEVKEKFTFMDVQKQDLILAKDELLTVICEMTKKMKEIFSENFEILRQNFHETFMELFKGGSADLILTEGDELTAKIDINVQPPGKKLQNISLMSGGEKVLSAIALLFAILKMKPTPFCILDEIEAALDDANVVRYAEFLTKFSDNVQFIIITHRKGTMEASDVLYGVTMEEKGVSKIVSVDFNK
ncbi:chromosome segregation protein SMC [Clostridium estertheticum]|uniref:chromosome segregation protein SMC n=1 Tax=Clostridium estertheticum TaxID=238834 RepID=UPI0013E95B00|nr:chromosome segregation protein SMC [Clostridium estertheticum]MBZ9687929.1 chromosome segregation protein SMC [Clostridium estertheticum]